MSQVSSIFVRLACGIVLSLISMVSFAAPRTAAEARALAMQFMGVSQRSLAKAPAKSADKESSSLLYIYNVERPQGGFVVVSGDNRFVPVLGYSQTGAYDASGAMPDGLAYWLSMLESEMQCAIESGLEEQPVQTPCLTALYGTVAPLITSTWAQSKPYNNLCPTSGGVNCVAGCVATGMAQLMRYYRYSGSLKTYDWDNMLDSYSGGYTAEQATAVAQLVADCGDASRMNYGVSSSGTAHEYAAVGLVNTFGYNYGMSIESRSHMAYEQWVEMIQTELAAKRPVLFSGMSEDEYGSSTNTGHFFILDGYDASQDTYHFNWGWNGYLDGYFVLTALNPGGGGTGAGAGSFNYHQHIMINLQPTQTAKFKSVRFTVDSIELLKESKARMLGNSMTVTYLAHESVDYGPQVGVGIFDPDGNLVAANTELISSFHAGTYYTQYSFDTPAPKASICPGDVYYLYPIARRDETSDPVRIPSKCGEIQGYKITFSGSTANYEATTEVVVKDADAVRVPFANEQNGQTKFYELSGRLASSASKGIVVGSNGKKYIRK